MSSGALYSRVYRVSIGTPRLPRQAVYGNFGEEASALRVAFEIEKGSASTPNKSTLSIFNLSPENRGVIEPGMVAIIEAGYAGAYGTLFTGVVSKDVRSSRSGADIETKMELGDGESAIAETRFSRSYDANVTLKRILGDVVGAMAQPTAVNPGGLTAGCVVGIPDKTYPKGMSVDGPCRNTMDQLCGPNGLEWSVQNSAIQIVPLDSHTGQTAEVLNMRTGLLDVPSFDGKVANFSALLNPRLTPGRLVSVESRALNGIFKVRGGKWRGDSHGNDWRCELQGIPMPNAVALSVLATPLDFTAAASLDIA